LRLWPAQVAWIEGDEAALAFEEALYEPVVENLQRKFVMMLRN